MHTSVAAYCFQVISIHLKLTQFQQSIITVQWIDGKADLNSTSELTQRLNSNMVTLRCFCIWIIMKLIICSSIQIYQNQMEKLDHTIRMMELWHFTYNLRAVAFTAAIAYGAINTPILIDSSKWIEFETGWIVNNVQWLKHLTNSHCHSNEVDIVRMFFKDFKTAYGNFGNFNSQFKSNWRVFEVFEFVVCSINFRQVLWLNPDKYNLFKCECGELWCILKDIG